MKYFLAVGYTVGALFLLGLCANAAQASDLTTTATSGSQSGALSRSANMGVNQGITFNSRTPDTRTVYATAPAVAPQSAFGFSGQNCGASDTAAVGTPWVSFGGSDAHGLVGCNTRADTVTLWKMGLHRVAKMRMLCFGLEATRKSFRSLGGVCPMSAPGDRDNRMLQPNTDLYGVQNNGALSAYSGK